MKNFASPNPGIIDPAIHRNILSEKPSLASGMVAPALRVIFGTLVAGLILLAASSQARAANLLVNPSFEANSGHALATGWTYYSPPTPPGYFGDYWIEGKVPAHAGGVYWKQWSALNGGTTNVSGIFEDFSSAPGSSYQASGWIYSDSHDNGGLGPDGSVWIEVSFLNASSNVLAIYKSDDFSASVGLDAWFNYPVTNACDPNTQIPSGDPYFTTYAVTGSVSQLVAPLGTAKIRYRFALRQSAVQGSCYFDDTALNQIGGPIPPTISNLFPDNMILVNPNDGLSFNVSSPSGFTINNNAIHLILNGTDVSSSLAISGSASSKTVAYHGLQSNLTYNASISVTDSFNFASSANTYFETTWLGVAPLVYLWEAEDFDFSSGLYINNPTLCNSPGNPNCYFGKVGVQDVDEHNNSSPPSKQYRPDDLMGTIVSGDYARKDHFLAGVQDYRIDPFNSGEWLNYTRDWTNGTYWIIGRLATGEGLSGSLTLSKVNSDSTTTDLGTFTISNGRGWSTFDYVYLRDTNGNLANITLNGKTTLRITSGGNLLPGFFALAVAQVDLPVLSNLYPTGTRPFEYTNALSFTVTSAGATFLSGGIKVILDGIDVSSALVITGSASTKNVVYPSLQPNSTHFATITVTNSLGHGILVTNKFDTFTQDNYMVEAEDFDYDGGQYVDPWFPGAYSGLGATTNIDFQHTTEGGEQFQYRADGIPESRVQNYTVEARDVFLNQGEPDFQLDWFGATDWANYTRAYPSGSYHAYVRSAGVGNFAMYLDQVVSGATTTNQFTRRLGQWSAAGLGQQTYQWVPLTDADGVAPAIVKLGGVNTLRITTPTGLCYPNYFMLVPAAGINLTAARAGNNITISFPTQNGAEYRVFYRNDLASGAWTLLTSIVGDGSVKSFSDPVTASRRFYMVTSP